MSTKYLDLDDRRYSKGELSVPARGFGAQGELQHSAKCYLHRVLLQALNDGALGMNLIADGPCNCLRVVVYRRSSSPQLPQHTELAPAPGVLAEPVFMEINELISETPNEENSLRIRFKKQVLETAVIRFSETEYQLFFGDTRFAMRHKE